VHLPGTFGGGPASVAALLFVAFAGWAILRRHPRRTWLLLIGLLALPTTLLSVLPAAAADTCNPTPGSVTGAFTSTLFKKGGGEPAISVSPTGRVVIADGLGGQPAGQPANLYRSTDYGKTFQNIRPSFPNAGGGDFDIRFLDDHTLIAADLATLSLPANGIYIDRSTDDGSTWTQTLINEEVYDRPWIDHFGTDKVYVATKGFDGVPYLYTSTDGARSFSPVPTLVYGLPINGGPLPYEIPLSANNAYVDHLTVDQHTGDVYVLYGIEDPQTFGAAEPAGVANQLYVAHLENGQLISHPVYIGAPGDSFISGFNWMTVDQAGTLYVLANGRINGHHSARLSVSKDKGRTWSSLVDLGAPGAANVYGAIAGGAAGALALVYLRGSNENPSTAQNWFAEMASVMGADTSAPTVVRSRPLTQPMHTADICFDGILCGLPGFGNDRSLLDYIWSAVGPDGSAWAVIASNGPASRDASATSPPDVVILHQLNGRSLGRGVQS
jgi:hypothetical protein